MRIQFLHRGVPVLIAPAGREHEFPWIENQVQPDIRVHGVGNVWLVRNHFSEAEQCAPGHHHHHDHLMLLTAGSIELAANGLITRYKADHIIIVPKETYHQVRSLEPNTTIWCVAALRDGETGDVIGPDDRPLEIEPLTRELATALGDIDAQTLPDRS